MDTVGGGEPGAATEGAPAKSGWPGLVLVALAWLVVVGFAVLSRGRTLPIMDAKLLDVTWVLDGVLALMGVVAGFSAWRSLSGKVAALGGLVLVVFLVLMAVARVEFCG